MPAAFTQFLKKLQPNHFQLRAAFICLLAFVILALLVCQYNIPLDDKILAKSQQWENTKVTAILKGITFLGNYHFLVPANILLLFFLLYKKENKAARILLFMSLTSLGLMMLLKDLFHRPRPEEAMISGIKNFSFPSGHAFMSITFFSLLAIVASYYIWYATLKKILLFLIILLILIIGFSRIYLRVHYTTDVVAGYCIGYSWLTFCLWIFTKPKVYTQSDAL
ncbi:MAG: hypothetical protein RIR12_401 [Bacteroidota bacterium]|jgi:undecaprenyl-diphosphatase